MTSHPWPAPAAANLTGVALVAGWGEVATAAGALWVFEFASRLLRIRTRPEG